MFKMKFNYLQNRFVIYILDLLITIQQQAMTSDRYH